MPDEERGRSYDAVIIGAGHNGLVASFYLARAGLDVLVLEQREDAGGLLATAEIVPGYRTNAVSNSCHNLEPSIVTQMRLQDFGLRFAHPDPSSVMAFADGRRFVAANSRSALADELKALNSGDVDGYFATLQVMSSLAEKLDVSFYEGPPSLADLYGRLDNDTDRALFHRLMFGSATDFLGERISSEEVMSLLGMVAISGNYLGPSTPGSAYMLFHRPLYRGSSATRSGERFHTLGTSKVAPIGGMAEIARAMTASARAAGAVIRTGTGVASIVTRHGRVTGVVTRDGEEYTTDAVLSAVNPKLTLTEFLTPDQLGQELATQARGIKMDGTAFKLMLAVAGTPRFTCAVDDAENDRLLKCGFRMGTTISGMDQGYHAALAGEWSREPIIWGLIPSSIDPTLAPEGGHVMSLTVFHAPPRLVGSTWDVEKDRFAGHIIDRLDALYFRRLKDMLVGYRALSPEDLQRDFGLVGAHVSHGDITAGQMFDARPTFGLAHYATPVAGLYLGSVGTWPGNYVSGLPGRNAARRLLADRADPDRYAEFGAAGAN
ncbi:NAD(P)/FAD-dependent oxidoreductase [Phytohabitans sp. ZYX-F-186]|uniref:Pyridine nucleotide-disulfide oxidoreductase domain-containing protein 2 n=1 Tax=Phytohabitans maris TaxID=3071409 RepID=A0ABU0ZWG3_9ACTN|nr:NAD(P)/FAD-dependent oxidoreductase [Phytohabitans sp. ZYX-F-186]MDQ7911366.1 NAD(P)/FAD-dependent oxidoreductase [Phytohabitans sp. ZYX-F-186]